MAAPVSFSRWLAAATHVKPITGGGTPQGSPFPGSRLSARRVGRLASSAEYAPRSPETEQQSNDDTAGRDNPESGPAKTNKFRQAGRGNGPEYDVSRHAAKCFPGHPG